MGIKNPTFGKVYYHAHKVYNFLNNERIEMVDENGVAWYRYEKPKVAVDVDPITYCGHLQPIVTGEIADYDMDEAEERHYFKSEAGLIDYYDISEVFLTEKEAVNSIKI